MRDLNVDESGDKKEETAGDPEGGPAERELTDREERQVMARPIDGFTREPEVPPGGGEMPGGGQQPPNMNFDRSDAGKAIRDNLILYGVCTGILVAAFVSAKRY